MCRVTFVCCFNDREQFERFRKQLKEQSEESVLIGIDNTESAFSSCAAAFNSVAGRLATPFVIYSHQDMIFESPDCVRSLADYLSRTGKDDITGVAGSRMGVFSSYTTISHGKDNKRPAGKYTVSGSEECETVDECLFGGYSEHFREGFRFDEKVCPDWHLYAVEQCLRTKLRGNKVWVCEARMYHCSDGIHNEKLHRGFRELSRAYAHDLKYICAPCCRGYTGILRRNWGYLKRNKTIKIMPASRAASAAVNRIDRLGRKNRAVRYILYGKELFK